MQQLPINQFLCVVKIIEKECKLQSLLILIEFNKNYVLYKLFWKEELNKYIYSCPCYLKVKKFTTKK